MIEFENEKEYLKYKKEYETGKMDNEKTSAMELWEWKNNPPEKYFLYIDEENRNAITWMGQKLGKVYFGKEYHSNLGDIRVPIDIHGNNGKKYHGTFYKSAGSYARIKQYKRD